MAIRTKKTYIATTLIMIGLLLGIASAVLFVRDRHAAQPPGTNASASGPSAAKPAPHEVDTYTVAPTLPKYITIPAIGLDDTRVKELGVSSNGQIASPSNVYDAGWYKESAKPGQPGAMFIYGHVSSWKAKGAFYDLHKLKPGDSVQITRGDNKVYTYKVVSLKTYPYNNVDMSQVLAPVDASKPSLNLMTCSGHVIKGTSEFDQRLVVFTSLSGS